MSSSEEIIENAGKEPGLEIWRIEDMELAVVPKNTYGTFYRHGFILSKNSFSQVKYRSIISEPVI